MLSLNATQQAIVAAANKDEVSWLFQVDKNGNDSVDYYWSTKVKAWDGDNYTFKIAEFDEIEMNRAQSESGIQAPSSFDFMISNKDNTLVPSDFSGGNVTLILVISAGGNEAAIRTWNFDIKGVASKYQTLQFHCVDWLQKFLAGNYPNTPLVSYLFPESLQEYNFCVPLIWGKPSIPVPPLVDTIVTNGCMEDDSNWANWGTTSPSVNERSTEHVKEGDYSRKVSVHGASSRSGIKSDVFTTENGKTYVVDFWAYCINCCLPYVAVRKGDDSGWILYEYYGFRTGHCDDYEAKWAHFSFSFTEGAATGGAGAYIVFYGWAEPDTTRTMYIDQVFLGSSKYLLGAKIADPTDYVVNEIATPRDWDGDRQIWSKDDYTFAYTHKTGADGNDYAVAEFIIADQDANGTPDSNITFKKSQSYLPVAAWMTRSDTIDDTSPADILDYILQDWGIPSARIDATTLAAVKSTYSGWGLTWNMGLWIQEEKKKLLSKLLLMCHTELIVRDKIYFKVHVKASQKTLTKADVLKTKDVGEGTFDYNVLEDPEIKDCAYTAFQQEKGCLDSLLQVLVQAKDTCEYISDDIIRADFIQDTQNVQRVGILALQRRFLNEAKITVETKGTCLALECDDVITLNHADYGGSYDVLIDSFSIKKDASIGIEATKFSAALDDWGDLSPATITITQLPDLEAYQIVISGPDALDNTGMYIGNTLAGRLRIGQTGNHILLDPVEPIQTLVEGGVTRMKIGDLGTDDWGIEFLDHSGNSIFKLDGSDNNTLAGWSATAEKLTCQSGEVGMNAEETGGVDWRFWAGHATPGSAPFRVDESGNLYCTLIYASGGTIGGWTLGATTLTSANITLDSDNDLILVNTLTIDGTNDRIRSGNYVSGMAGAGFTLEPDLLEVGNIAARGIIRTAVFQKDIVSALGGSFIFSKGADVLASDMTAADASTLTIEGNETFAVGDFLWIKDDTNEEWLEVTNIGSAPTYTVTRDKDSDYGADSNPAWKKGATVVNTGQSGDGFVYMTASETNAPYLSVITHAGAPWTTLTTHLRLGNLNGFLGYTSDLYGIAIGSADDYLKYEPTNGLRIKGLVEIIGSPGLQNMLMNGGFEETDGTNAYYWTSGAGIATETTGGDDSNNYLKLTRAGADIWSYQKNPDATDRYFEVNEGETYEFGGSVKSDGTCGWRIQLRVTDKDKANRTYPKISGTDAAWVTKSETYTIQAGEKFINIAVKAHTADGWAAFDNVYLKRVDELAWSWSDSSDRTKIDGGTIYTGTIVASAIKGTDFGTLTITSGKIVINTTDALEIGGSGNIKVLAGGDITMTPSDTNPALIKWSTVFNMGAAATAARGLCIWPTDAATKSFRIGFDPVNNTSSLWNAIDLLSAQYITLSTTWNADNMTSIGLYSHTAGASKITLNIEASGTQQYFYFYQDKFYPSYNKQSDLGLDGHAWDDVYADDYNNEADFYHLDNYSDLQTILGIKPSGEIDERTGLPLIDDDTLPDWMLTKYKQDGETKDKDDKVISTYKKGDIARGPEGKPWISNKVMFSLLMGSIKELNQKIEDLS